MSDKVKVLICDDHRLFREGVRAVLRHEPWIEIVGEADNGFDAVKKALRLVPDVVLMDLNMPVMSGLEATQQIKQAQRRVKVLVLSMYNEEEIVASALAAGASGYIQKDAQFSELIRAIDVVRKGGTYLFPGFFKRSFERTVKEYPGRLRGRLPTKRRMA